MTEPAPGFGVAGGPACLRFPSHRRRKRPRQIPRALPQPGPAPRRSDRRSPTPRATLAVGLHGVLAVRTPGTACRSRPDMGCTLPATRVRQAGFSWPQGRICSLRTFAGAVAIVTGGASGIGRALGEALARRGAWVVLADLQVDQATEIAIRIREGGGRANAEALDVTDFLATNRLIQNKFQSAGRLDYVFNVAGIGIVGEARYYELEDWYRVLDVNLRGVVHGVQAAYPIMLRQGFGHIVNMASGAGLWPSPFVVGGSCGGSTVYRRVSGSIWGESRWKSSNGPWSVCPLVKRRNQPRPRVRFLRVTGRQSRAPRLKVRVRYLEFTGRLSPARSSPRRLCISYSKHHNLLAPRRGHRFSSGAEQRSYPLWQMTNVVHLERSFKRVAPT